MGELDRRIEALEAQFAGETELDEEYEKQQWIARAHIHRNRDTPPDVTHARGLIRLFRLQNILSGMSAEELIERIMSWRPVPEGGRSRVDAEMEVARVVYNQEADTEHMLCPPEWEDAFVAGEDLYEKYLAVPDEVLAESEAVEDLEGYGITEYLLVRAIGPDAERISEEERAWRLSEILADAVYGEKGYRVLQLAVRKQEAGE